MVDEIENLAIDRLCTLFWCQLRQCTTSPVHRQMRQFLACLQPGDDILGFDLSHGGHLSHGSAVNFSGLFLKPILWGWTGNQGRIDMDKVAAKAREVKPKLIICGASAYSRDWDYARFRAIADEVGAILLADIAHPAGLIAARTLNDPLPHCHIVTSTTHKTLRGPRGGIIMMYRDFETLGSYNEKRGSHHDVSHPQQRRISGMQGGPLEHVIAAKAVAFGEALQPEYKTYIKQVKANAAVMATALHDLGYGVISGGTDNHLMLIDLRSKHPDSQAGSRKCIDQGQTLPPIKYGTFRFPICLCYIGHKVGRSGRNYPWFQGSWLFENRWMDRCHFE